MRWSRGRGLRAGAEALNLAACVADAVRHSSYRSAEPGPCQTPESITVPVLRGSAKSAASRPGNAASAYFPAFPDRRFPPNILSLIRSFARHPALLSREMKMAVQPGGFNGYP